MPKKNKLPLDTAKKEHATEIINEFKDTAVDKIEVEFSGSGDSGAVDNITFEPEFECTDKQREMIETVSYEMIAAQHDGWENNDGASGKVIFDVKKRTVTVDIEEYFTDSTTDTATAKL